jgi:hypothetical protein
VVMARGPVVRVVPPVRVTVPRQVEGDQRAAHSRKPNSS